MKGDCGGLSPPSPKTAPVVAALTFMRSAHSGGPGARTYYLNAAFSIHPSSRKQATVAREDGTHKFTPRDADTATLKAMLERGELIGTPAESFFPN